MIFDDKDIKIASDKPSQDIKKNMAATREDEHSKGDAFEKAREWGAGVAREFIKDARENPEGADCDFEMVIQRRLLLSFTATVGFEQYANDDTAGGIAQKSFLDTLKGEDKSLFETAQDTGAFSFYYLAFRRGGDVVRRMGQTFAMLCLHDGDPIYQELGEALYCWFLSVVKSSLQN